LMANRQVQTGIIDVLGTDWRDVTISTGLATQSGGNIFMALTDPVGAIVIDGQGRRLGWTPDTGILAEMPNSVWYGEGDGIGFVYGDVPQPLRVELVGLGENHLLQVVGEQGEQRIGLQDDGSLASGEIKNLQPETRAKLSPPAVTAGQASEADDSFDALLIGTIVVFALVLVAIVLTLRRRRLRA
jgi:hypothetical protein